MKKYLDRIVTFPPLLVAVIGGTLSYVSVGAIYWLLGGDPQRRDAVLDFWRIK